MVKYKIGKNVDVICYYMKGDIIFVGFRFWSSSSLGSIFTLQHSWQTIFLVFCWGLCHFIWCL